MKLLKAVLLPNSLQYHVDNGLSLYENVYRYSSDAFVNLFTEARTALREGKIKLNEEDLKLLNETDIGLYGVYEGEKVPLDLPMVGEQKNLTINDFIRMVRDDMMAGGASDEYVDPEQVKKVAQRKYNEYLQGASEEELFEAEYRSKKVQLNNPKRGGSKKFYVYTKNKKGNVVKVSFGDTGLSVKFKQPGARASFAARHKCAQKKDKTKAGYWSCNIGRYWKSLGGSKNVSGYW